MEDLLALTGNPIWIIQVNASVPAIACCQRIPDIQPLIPSPRLFPSLHTALLVLQTREAAPASAALHSECETPEGSLVLLLYLFLIF